MGSGGMPMLVPAALLAGLAIFDTALVVISRYRRRARICQGARDHTTHRLLPSLRRPRAVVAALGLVQSGMCALAMAATWLGTTGNVLIALQCVAAATVAAWMLERQAPSVDERAVAELSTSNGHVDTALSTDDLLTALEVPRAAVGFRNETDASRLPAR
jgi:hypothetical protein